MKRPVSRVVLLFSLLFMIMPICGAAAENSGDTLIRSITLQNGTMPAFDHRVGTYSAVLDPGETVPEFVIAAADDAVTVEISGTDSPVRQDEPAEVTVSAYLGGRSCAYTIFVSCAGEGSGLSFLQCTNGTMSPLFRETVDSYFITLPYDQTEVMLDIRPLDPDAAVCVIGAEDPQPGKQMKACIEVTAQDGRTFHTELHVFRLPDVVSAVRDDFLLSSLEVNGGTVAFAFSSKCGYYEVPVGQDVVQLNISAVPANRRNAAVVIGSPVVTGDAAAIVHVAVFDPASPDAGQSIYTLSFRHDSFSGTPRYTRLQMLACVLCAGAGGVALGVISAKRGRRNEEGS